MQKNLVIVESPAEDHREIPGKGLQGHVELRTYP